MDQMRRITATCLLVSLLAACGSSDESDGSDGAPPSDAPALTEAPAPEETPPAETAGEDDGVPDGPYRVGDTYTDGDFEFVYEGLVKVPFDSQGAYTEGECYFAVGSVTFIEGPSSQTVDSDSFSPAFNPIIGGVVDTEQNDEFFNCDAQAVGSLGYSQTSTTDVALGETAKVWLDAIYVAPDRSGQLEGFQLYRVDDLIFEAEVTTDVSG